ncbi:hypothetical protein [Mycolicibacter sinensis]|uniref:hypothetical protein n=1 Tax=Mycolicibacter sinensis (strain JDM601) TaxID=875328 RepID=UPI0013016272|nr:hypothetical protein [Mycolicibacter sinensis]
MTGPGVTRLVKSEGLAGLFACWDALEQLLTGLELTHRHTGRAREMAAVMGYAGANSVGRRRAPGRPPTATICHGRRR